MPNVKRVISRMLSSNTYVLWKKDTGIIIDPGAEVDDILKVVEGVRIKIKYIILTHVHIDHILFVDELREKLECEVAVHKSEADYMTNAWQNGARLFGLDKIFKPADLFLEDGMKLLFNDEDLEIIHTPGHTPGSICLKIDKYLFTGDTLFRMSIGATHLGNGNQADLDNSLLKIMELSDDIIVLPGHGTSSTIGYERCNNPYINS
jgi:hydroxyacylglutathione hydrolase